MIAFGNYRTRKVRTIIVAQVIREMVGRVDLNGIPSHMTQSLNGELFGTLSKIVQLGSVT